MESFLTFGRMLELCGLATGVLYLWFEYHANPKMWVVGIIMPTISFYVYYSAGLYADFAMNFYYFFMAIYGYLAWTFHWQPGGKRKKRNLPITRIKWKEGALTLLAFMGVYALIAWWLVRWTDSTVPYWDAFTTAASIVATWMLTRKYLEQWLVWLAVDAVCAGLYLYKDRPFYAILYALYTIVALFGYLKWRRMMRQD